MRLGALMVLVTAASVVDSLGAQQVWGSIRGRVVEESTAIAAAQIQVSSPDLLGTRTALTDRDGYYHIHALPPGVYTVRITHLGRRPVRVDGVSIQLGRVTALEPTIMESSPTRLDEVRITANRLAIDPTSTVTGATLTPEDYALLPSERDYKSLIEILPNIVQSGRGDPVNANGATGLENAYVIDGMNVTSELKAETGTSLPYNFIKAVEVKTGGYEAQYGKALGAVVNAVTYTGTNDFGVNVFAFSTHSALSSKPKAAPTLRESNALSYDVGVRVGGPIVRDRIWYSAAYNPRVQRSEREVSGLGVFVDEQMAHIFAAKTSWRASDVANLELSVFGDPTTHRSVEPNAIYPGYTPLNADPYLMLVESGNTVGAIRGTISLSRVLLEASAARSHGQANEIGATTDAQNQPLFVDNAAATISGGLGIWSRSNLDRSTLVLKATSNLGRHTTVLGLEFEDVSVFRDLGWTGGYTVETIASGGFRTTSEGAPGTFHNHVPTTYAQESFRFSDSWTFNAGVRWSAQTLTAASGRIAQRFPDEWQPRLGLVWQPSASHRDRLFASFGRFYLQEPLNLSTLWFLDYPFVWAYYSTDPRQTGAIADSVKDYGTPESDWTRNIRGLQVENSDEIAIGYERLVGASLKVTTRAVRRELRSSFQWGLDPASGTWYLGTPGKADFDILPKPVRQYLALEIVAEGHRRTLDYRASYVLSRNRGNYPGLYNSDLGFANPGGAATFFIPMHAINSTGLLPNDHTHLFKFSGSRRMTFGLTGGAFLTVQSGAPLNAFGTAPSGHVLFVYPRGSAGRTPWLWDANLRFAQQLRSVGRTHSRILLDVLHAGNPQRPVRLIETMFQRQLGIAAPVVNPDYRHPLTYQPPMTARLGMEVDF